MFGWRKSRKVRELEAKVAELEKQLLGRGMGDIQKNICPPYFPYTDTMRDTVQEERVCGLLPGM